MTGSLGNLVLKLYISPPLIFVVKIKFPRATYHTIVPSTEELFSLNKQNIEEVTFGCDIAIPHYLTIKWKRLVQATQINILTVNVLQ